ncbi:MAG: hypothetical protein HYT76_03010 [Deltaproteobacteria bacterium]|nr:hypothetical protein [Deltaproteobacteria bacterium]
MAKVPSIPPEYQKALFDSVAYRDSDRPPAYFTDEKWEPITGREHLDQIRAKASEGFTVSGDEDTDPGLSAEKILGGRVLDESALREDPSTPKRYGDLLSGKKKT